MSSAVKVILGVSVLAMAAGFAACDNGGSPTGPLQVAGSSNGTGGSASPGTGGTSQGTAGSSATLPGIPLDPMAGWVAVTNDAKIQGAIFSFGDNTSKMGLVSDFTGSKACIAGTAAKVDLACTPVPPEDCYGQFWGVAIGMNLNQTTDPATMMGGTPMAYDATNLDGFYFEVQGNTVPGPTDFRFKVENSSKEFCTPKTVKVKSGANTIHFSDLMAECWHTTEPPNATVTPDVQSKLIKISWQVVTNSGGTVPFDFCIANIRAIPKSGTNGAPPGSSSGGATGAGGAAAGGASAGGAGGTSAGGTSAGGTSAGGTSAGGTSAGGTSAGGASAGGPSAGSGGAKAGSGGTGG